MRGLNRDLEIFMKKDPPGFIYFLIFLNILSLTYKVTDTTGIDPPGDTDTFLWTERPFLKLKVCKSLQKL
jgi:hypothetical protein